MKMVKVRILNTELEAALLNPKIAKQYEDGIDAIAKKAEESKLCDTGYKSIEAQCNAVIDFIDDIFGAGSAKEVVGEETDLLTCLEAYRDIAKIYDEQVIPYIKEFQSKLDMKASGA